MGTSAQERIALAIETTSNTAGARDVRTALNQVTESAVEANAKLVATAEQSRAAWAKSGGDMKVFASELEKIVRGEQQVAAGAGQMAGALAAVPEAEKATTPAVQRITDSTRAMTLTQIRAIEINNAMGTSVERISPRARSAANGLAILVQSAATGGGSMAGLAVAAGGVSTNLLALSKNAQIAASASGIGAIITVIGVLIPLLTEAKNKTDGFSQSARHLGDYQLEGLRNAEAGKRAQLDAATKAIADYAEQQHLNMADFSFGGIRGKAKELLDLQRRTAGELQAITDARIAAEAAANRKASADANDLREKDLKTATTLEAQYLSAYQDLHDKRTLTEQQAARQKVERDFAAALDDINALYISEAEKTRLTGEAAALRAERIAGINEDFRKREAAARLADWEKEKAQRDAQVTYLEKLQLTMAAHAHQVALGQESLRSAMTKAMLEPLVAYLEGKAVSEGIEALASLAFFDFAGAARHAAVAAAAIAGASKVAQIAGLSGGGGGGVAAGAAGGPGGGTFTPQRAAAGEHVVVNLITQNPYSGEAMSVVSYELQRGGVLKRPINVPPTNGLALAGLN